MDAGRPARLGGSQRRAPRPCPASLASHDAVFIGIAPRLCLDLARQNLDLCRQTDTAPRLGIGILRVLMIEARWGIRIADDLRRSGHALDGLLKEVGLVRADLSTAEDRILYAAYVGLIERAAVLLGQDPTMTAIMRIVGSDTTEMQFDVPWWSVSKDAE